MAYSQQQLEQIWNSAGGQPGAAAVMAAIAMAESGGNPDAISPSNDYGLWQINGSNFATTGLNSGNWMDPQANAAAAVILSSGGANIAAWCTAWANPAQDCGHGVLTTPQPGSAAYQYLGGATNTATAGPATASSSGSSGSGSQGSGSMERLIALVGTKGPAIFNLSETYPTVVDAQGWEQEQSFGDWILNQLGALFGVGGNAKTPPAPLYTGQGLQQAATGLPVLGTILKDLSNIEKAAGVATGILIWLTSPINLLRVVEVAVGGVISAASVVMFLALLFPNLSRTLSSSAGALSLVMGPMTAAKGAMA